MKGVSQTKLDIYIKHMHTLTSSSNIELKHLQYSNINDFDNNNSCD